jgi:hypothetical protein
MQNTTKSFRGAADNKDIYGIETDIWKSTTPYVAGEDETGHFFCSHDPNPFWTDVKTNGGSTEYLNKQFYEFANKLIPQSHSYYTVSEDDAYVPTFHEYLQIIRNNNKHAFIEIKEPSHALQTSDYFYNPEGSDFYFRENDIHNLIDVTRNNLNSLNNVTFITFDTQELDWAKSYVQSEYPNDTCHFQQLIETESALKTINKNTEWQDWGIRDYINNDFDISLSIKAVNRNIVDYTHKHNKQIGLWSNSSYDSPSIWAPYIRMGVDFITSDWTPEYK